jgi:hypothetical protein
MVKTYKVGYVIDMTSGTMVFKELVASKEYYIDIPFKLPEVLQRYDPSTPCKVLLEHMFLKGAENTLPNAIKIRYIGNSLASSYNVKVEGNGTETFESFDVLGEAAIQTGKTNNFMLYVSRDTVQPEHDFDLLTTTGGVASGGPYLRIAFKAMAGESFTPTNATKLDLCLVFVVLEKEAVAKPGFL